MVDPLFRVHRLNGEGLHKAGEIAKSFNGLLEELRLLCPESTREFSIVKTKLEEACFFAKKAVANVAENQEPE